MHFLAYYQLNAGVEVQLGQRFTSKRIDAGIDRESVLRDHTSRKCDPAAPKYDLEVTLAEVAEAPTSAAAELAVGGGPGTLPPAAQQLHNEVAAEGPAGAGTVLLQPTVPPLWVALLVRPAPLRLLAALRSGACRRWRCWDWWGWRH
eukprot:scaffold12.g8057.t1